MKLSDNIKQQIIAENNSFKDFQYGNLSKNERKKLGAFYTPGEICIKMLEQFNDELPGKTILDPCCGSGNLLAAAIIAGADPELVYGNEIDPEMIILCRNRLDKLCDSLNRPRLPEQNLHFGNALDTNAIEDFSLEYKLKQNNEYLTTGKIFTGFTAPNNIKSDKKDQYGFIYN